MEDSMKIAADSLRNKLFFWEVVITIIVFAAAFYIFKGFKDKERAARAKNKGYSTGSEPEN